MNQIEIVERLPAACWACGVRIRGTRQQGRRQKSAQAKIFLAWLITLVWLPLIMGLGIGVVAICEIRLDNLFIPYVAFLFAVGCFPGGLLYRQGRVIPRIFTVICPKCDAQREMIIERSSL